MSFNNTKGRALKNYFYPHFVDKRVGGSTNVDKRKGGGHYGRGGDYSKLFPWRVVLDAFCHNKNTNYFQN